MDQCPQKIFFGGYEGCTHLGEKLTNIDNGRITYKPLNSIIKHPLLSISIYHDHSVVVTRDGLIYGIGNNNGGQICPSKKECLLEFTEIPIEDKLIPLSAVCTTYGTLYLYSTNEGNEKKLVYCESGLGKPIHLNIGNQQPIALFGGHYHTAAISDKGEVIFINRFMVKNSSNSPITAFPLPNGEKASSIACGNDSVVVLSQNGLVFRSSISNQSNVLNFEYVDEFDGEKVDCISGSFEHFIAVCKSGRVFGCGRNMCGELGLGKKDKTPIPYFIEILTFNGYKIIACYAGVSNSFFVTQEGKILSCGWDNFGQLLRADIPKESVCLPTETLINSDAKFCIASNVLGLAFIEKPPPPNTPNMRITL